MLDLLDFPVIGLVIIGFIFLTGFLIISINLGHRGVSDLRLINRKYFLEGGIFIVLYLSLILLALIPTYIFLLMVSGNIVIEENIADFYGRMLIISVAAPISILLVSRKKFNWSFILATIIFYVFGILGNLFSAFCFSIYTLTKIQRDIVLAQSLQQPFIPSSALIYYFLIPSIIVLLINYLPLIIFYGTHLFGKNLKSHHTRKGMSYFQQVHILFDKQHKKLYKSLGLPIVDSGFTDMLYLIADTDEHFIISKPSKGDPKKISETTIKLSKNYVVAIVHHPENKQKPK